MLPGQSFLFGAFKNLTKRFCPYQTPNRVRRPGNREPARTGLYQKMFKWSVRNQPQINWWLGDRGRMSVSTGTSNWPTMTGIDEYSIESFWYRGGRDVQVGDLVVIRNTAKKESAPGAWLCKRIVGFAGYSSTRRLGHLGMWSRVIV